MGGARGEWIGQAKTETDKLKIVSILEKIFSKPEKVKFSNIHLLAVLVGALYRYHQDFAIGVIDNVLEQVTVGLEQNDFRFNQRRLAEAKYLGELYNYKMVDSTVIFDTLYRMVTFGHEGGRPTPGRQSPLDLSDDFFRIRLVCIVLDTCGVCFDRGSSRKKLDFFLTFFQYYLLTKDVLPMEIDFLVQDTLTLVRPQWKLVTDIAEASKLFSEAIAANYKLEAQEKVAEINEDQDESGSDEEAGDDEALPDIDGERSTDEAEDLWQQPFHELTKCCRSFKMMKMRLWTTVTPSKRRSTSLDKKKLSILKLKLTSIVSSRK